MDLKLNVQKRGLSTTAETIHEEFTLHYGHIFKGEKGDKGADGKSAYQQAVEAGYKGSEEDFKGLLLSYPNKADKNGYYPNMSVGIADDVKNGNTKYLAATPSGDPMHYAYEATGAVWNASTEYWELNDIANITNSEMRAIFNEAYLLAAESLLTAWFNGSTQRTNICLCRWQARTAINTFGNCVNIEVATLGRQGYKASPTNLNYAFYPCKKLKKIITIIDCNNCTSFTAAFNGCYMLEEVRLEKLNKSISFADSPNLSTESILYMIENATATTAITITLHEDAYMSAMENDDIVMALAEKTKVKLASA